MCVFVSVGADLSDYFNYGFNEDSWKAYCDKQKRLRMGLEVSTVGSVTSKITVRDHWLLIFHFPLVYFAWQDYLKHACKSRYIFFNILNVKFTIMDFIVTPLRCSRAGRVMKRTRPVCPFIHRRQTSPLRSTCTSQPSVRSTGNSPT